MSTARPRSEASGEEDVETLKAIAREEGIGHTTLIRMWVREQLNAYNKRGQQ